MASSKHKGLNITKEFLIQKHVIEQLTWSEIASELGCSSENIGYFCRKFDIPNQTIRHENLTGQTFGNWLVLKKHANASHNKTVIWTCECQCENKTVTNITSSSLRSGANKSCGRCKFYQDIPGVIWSRYKVFADRRNLEFSITNEYLWNLYILQEKKCALSGIELIFSTQNKDWWRETTASLDRIDSTKGYIEGNLQWIHKYLNLMKSNWTDEEFIEWCKLVANYNNN